METLVANPIFEEMADDERIEKTVRALEANGFQALVVEHGEQARAKVLDLLPEGAEVFTAGSRTLERIGLSAEIEQSGRFNAVRSRLLKMDRQTQFREMQQLGASPEIVVGSVQAITEQGQVLMASTTGSQMASYVFGAGQVIWVVGTQKLVKDLDTGWQRIEEYAYPREIERVRALGRQDAVLAKILVVQHEVRPGRTTIILVKEQLGY
jgi:hypothetical protein